MLLVCVLVCAAALAGAVALVMPKRQASTQPEVQPAAAPIATIGPPPSAPVTPSERKTTARPVDGSSYRCRGYSGVESWNPLAQIRQGKFAWGDDPPHKVGTPAGDVDWRSDPYRKPSWYMWLHSLRWLGHGIMAGSKDHGALNYSLAVIRDWIRDNPYSWKGDVGAWESTMHRTNVLICAREAVLATRKARELPEQYKWLDESLLDHAKFMRENWSGPSNHGTDESIAMFGVGCVLRRNELKQLATERLGEAIEKAIDDQGSTNEQSVGYARFNYDLWGRAASALQACGTDPGEAIGKRRDLMAEWLALATNETGYLHQVGDSQWQQVGKGPGTPIEYAESLGKRGHRPGRRIGIFDAGYVFGRTGWGEKRAFTQESTYSIRYGPARALHGHDDHTSITYSSRGRQVLVDPGSSGYQLDKWQEYIRSPFAHNVMTVPSAKAVKAETKLVRSVTAPTSEFYEFSGLAAEGVERTRGALVLKDPDLVVTLDRGKSGTSQRYETLWHLPPGQKVTVKSPDQAVALKPGEKQRTFLLQIPYREQLPANSVKVVEGQQGPVQGWYWNNIFNRKPAPVVQFGRDGQEATILSVIVPAGLTENVSHTTRTDGELFFVDLTVGKQKVSVRITPDGRLSRAL